MVRHPRLLTVTAWLACLVAIGVGIGASFPRGELKDFGSFIAAGQAARQGLNPYAGDYPLVFRPYHPALGSEIVSPNLNPPLSLLVFEPLALFDPVVAFGVWYGLSLLLYLLALLLLARAYPGQTTPLRIAWALSLAGLWHTLELGQIYLPLLLATIGAVLLLRRDRPLLAGLLIGLVVAIKPNLAVWPVLLLAAGFWRAGMAGLGAAGLLSLLPLLRYPPAIYSQWFEAGAGYTGRILPINSSLPGLAERLGLPWLGIILSLALLIGLAVWAWRYRPSSVSVSGLALLAALLAAPIAWIGYTPLLLPVFFRRNWGWSERIVAVMLAMPYAATPLASWAPPFVEKLGWYIWALLLLLVVLVREGLRGYEWAGERRSSLSGRVSPP